MTTTNPYAVTEEALGLPGADELTVLANAWFPDLADTAVPETVPAQAPASESAAVGNFPC